MEDTDEHAKSNQNGQAGQKSPAGSGKGGGFQAYRGAQGRFGAVSDIRRFARSSVPHSAKPQVNDLVKSLKTRASQALNTLVIN
jgi:hypothetical protein